MSILQHIMGNVGDISISPRGESLELPLLNFQFASDHQMKYE
jgi:hypothetical protein